MLGGSGASSTFKRPANVHYVFGQRAAVQSLRGRDLGYPWLRILCTISAFSFTSSFMRGYMPTKMPSLGLMLWKAVRNAPSIPSFAIRPAARILNAKQGFVVCRITLYIFGGSLCR